MNELIELQFIIDRVPMTKAERDNALRLLVKVQAQLKQQEAQLNAKAQKSNE